MKEGETWTKGEPRRGGLFGPPGTGATKAAWAHSSQKEQKRSYLKMKERDRRKGEKKKKKYRKQRGLDERRHVGRVRGLNSRCSSPLHLTPRRDAFPECKRGPRPSLWWGWWWRARQSDRRKKVRVRRSLWGPNVPTNRAGSGGNLQRETEERILAALLPLSGVKESVHSRKMLRKCVRWRANGMLDPGPKIICSVRERDRQWSDGTFLPRCCLMSQLLVCCLMAHGEDVSDVLRDEFPSIVARSWERRGLKKLSGRCWVIVLRNWVDHDCQGKWKSCGKSWLCYA